MKNVMFEGPVGTLEGFVTGESDARFGAVLCHPHPQYGGNMYDAVVGEMATALANCGYAVLCFNFRGTGASEGAYDGEAEVDDFLAAVSACPSLLGVPASVVGGYSFGSMIALRGYPDSGAQKLILTAPPLQMNSGGVQPDDSMLVMLGNLDQIVPIDSTAQHFADSRVAVIDGADHFFAGFGPNIADYIEEFV